MSFRTIRLSGAICALMLGACAGQVDGDLEDVDSRTDFIVGGTAISGLPAVGALVRNSLRNTSSFCTATLISPTRVVTAAHCLDGQNARSIYFVTGPSVQTYDSYTRGASMRIHPNYDRNRLLNDIAYLDLEAEVPHEPMRLLAEMDRSWVGTSLRHVGYGITSGGGSGGGIKRAVNIPITRVDATQFRYSASGKNTCNGDSGGPAFWIDGNGTYFIAGVTSYGDQSCTQYGANTRVDPYFDFLGVLPEEPVDPCGGETYAGRCDGNTVTWCEAEEVKTIACNSRTCGYQASRGIYNCL